MKGEDAREWMVRHDLAGIRDERVLKAFREVDRALFVPDELRESAYADSPLPIGHGQTISQPFIVAYMLEQLNIRPDHRVLEVGAGSGYVVALLTRLCKEVVATELVRGLAILARKNLRRNGASNYVIIHDPRTLGAPERAPFDRVIVSAAAPALPRELVDQLVEGGVMIIPIGTTEQWLWRVTKEEGAAGEALVTRERLLPVRFVPLKRVA